MKGYVMNGSNKLLNRIWRWIKEKIKESVSRDNVLRGPCGGSPPPEVVEAWQKLMLEKQKKNNDTDETT
jgi:hypothetical protein